MLETGHGVWVEKEAQWFIGAPSTFLIFRSEQARASLGPPEHITGELKDTEPATGPPGLPLASSHEHQDGGKRCEVS